METIEKATESPQVVLDSGDDRLSMSSSKSVSEVKPEALSSVQDDDDDLMAGPEIPVARKKRGDGRSVRFEIVMSESEIKKRDELAERHCCTGAQLVRALIMSRPLPDRGQLNILNEMRRQGGLMKHLAGKLLDDDKHPEVADQLLSIARQILDISVKMGGHHEAHDQENRQE